jgi:hypothetical protein
LVGGADRSGSYTLHDYGYEYIASLLRRLWWLETELLGNKPSTADPCIFQFKVLYLHKACHAYDNTFDQIIQDHAGWHAISQGGGCLQKYIGKIPE